jgi:hypothetical protein
MGNASLFWEGGAEISKRIIASQVAASTCTMEIYADLYMFYSELLAEEIYRSVLN